MFSGEVEFEHGMSPSEQVPSSPGLEIVEKELPPRLPHIVTLSKFAIAIGPASSTHSQYDVAPRPLPLVIS